MDVVTTEPTSVMLDFPQSGKVEATTDMELLDSDVDSEEARKKRGAQLENAAMIAQLTSSERRNEDCDDCCECFGSFCHLFVCDCDVDGDANDAGDSSPLCGDCDCGCGDCDCDCAD